LIFSGWWWYNEFIKIRIKRSL